MRTWYALMLMLVAATLPCGVAGGQQVEVETFRLANGMEFLLVPRYEEPNTVSCGWLAKVGSVNERPGITGISHFFEHMMFKGTTTIGTSDPERDADSMRSQKAVKDRINMLIWTDQYERYRRGEIDDPWDPANDTEEIRELRAKLKTLMDRHKEVINKNEFDRIYTNAGASGMNAFTSHDMTFYFIDVPSNKMELWCWMESDRLNDSVFREFYAERDVVHEERRMVLESNPTGELDEQFDARFWVSSPYSWSIIGHPTDIHSYTREAFEDYWNVYYRPNNLVGVIVGDFDPAATKPLLEEYFGRLQRGKSDPPPVVTLEQKHLGEVRMNGECECQPQLEVRYHTVPFMHRDGYVLDVLAEVLNGRTGRLYKSMIEGLEIASSASASQDSRKYAGYFSFRSEVKGEATPADLEAAWYEQVERLKTEPVGADELQKIKNRLAADAYRRLQSNNFLRLQLGYYEGSGGWEYINEAPKRHGAVTAADIQRVVNEYFTADNRAVATYLRRVSEDGGETEVNPIDALPEPMRAQFQQGLERITKSDDPEELRFVMGQIEGQLGMMPPELKEVMEYMLVKVRERIAALEG